MIWLLSFILFLLLFLVGRERGFKTFVTFYISIILIILYILIMSFNVNAIILALIICILSTVICLFLLNGYNIKTKSSFISIMIILVLIFPLIFFISKNANIQGFSMEDIETIGYYSFDINYDMTNVVIGMYLVCIIGTIIDTSISISSAMNEVLVNNPKLSSKELFKSGMSIGQDILGTTVNTLFFALICTFIGFFMWHKELSLEYLLNYKVFAFDLIQLLISFIGSILIVPITSYVSSIMLKK